MASVRKICSKIGCALKNQTPKNNRDNLDRIHKNIELNL